MVESARASAAEAARAAGDLGRDRAADRRGRGRGPHGRRAGRRGGELRVGGDAPGGGDLPGDLGRDPGALDPLGADRRHRRHDHRHRRADQPARAQRRDRGGARRRAGPRVRRRRRGGAQARRGLAGRRRRDLHPDRGDPARDRQGRRRRRRGREAHRGRRRDRRPDPRRRSSASACRSRTCPRASSRSPRRSSRSRPRPSACRPTSSRSPASPRRRRRRPSRSRPRPRRPAPPRRRSPRPPRSSRAPPRTWSGWSAVQAQRVIVRFSRASPDHRAHATVLCAFRPRRRPVHPFLFIIADVIDPARRWCSHTAPRSPARPQHTGRRSEHPRDPSVNYHSAVALSSEHPASRAALQPSSSDPPPAVRGVVGRRAPRNIGDHAAHKPHSSPILSPLAATPAPIRRRVFAPYCTARSPWDQARRRAPWSSRAARSCACDSVWQPVADHGVARGRRSAGPHALTPRRRSAAPRSPGSTQRGAVGARRSSGDVGRRPATRRPVPCRGRAARVHYTPPPPASHHYTHGSPPRGPCRRAGRAVRRTVAVLPS